MNEFSAAATHALIHNDGIVDELIGDEVTSLFVPGVAGPECRRKAALAAALYPPVEEQHPVGRADRVAGREQPVDVVVLPAAASVR